MERKLIIKATEQEILDLINEHCAVDEESIVALEELGNQDWVVDVSPECFDDEMDYIVIRNGKRCLRNFCVREALNHLCNFGHLEAGEYIIDCTW